MTTSPSWRPLPGFFIPLCLSLFIVATLIYQKQQTRPFAYQPPETYVTPPVPTTIPTPTPFVFSGIGIRIRNFQESQILVEQVIPSSPAEMAGIKADDLITQIDNLPVSGTVDDAVSLIRGPEGSSVILTIERQGKQLTQKIVRQTIIDTLPLPE
ncbi:MAG: PDZ domain-containing protein [Candidatus Shapirobacteria bacterium]|jgi:carboxyl-terminal processing protease